MPWIMGVILPGDRERMNNDSMGGRRSVHRLSVNAVKFAEVSSSET